MLFQDLLHNGNEETRVHLRLQAPPSPCLTTLDMQSPGTKRTRLPRGQQYEPAPFHSTDNQTVTGHGTSATQSRRNLSGSAGFLPRTAPSRSRGPAAQCHRRPNTAPRKARGTHLFARRASTDSAAVPSPSATGVSEPGGSGGSGSTPPVPVAAALPGGRTLGRTVRRARRNMAAAPGEARAGRSRDRRELDGVSRARRLAPTDAASRAGSRRAAPAARPATSSAHADQERSGRRRSHYGATNNGV